MVFNDVFLDLNPLYAGDSNLYKAHGHEIVASVVFYHIIMALCPWMATKLFGKNYTALSTKDRKNFDIHIVAFIQCLISIAAIAPLYQDKFLQENPILGYHPYAAFVSSITIGYFIWDLFVCLQYYSLFGMGFLVHAVAALFVFASTLRPFCLDWVCGFLAFELSSPFVNINWFLTKLPADFAPAWFTVVNGLTLIVVFFLVRIVWGFYAIYAVTLEFIKFKDQLPLWLVAIIIFLNFSLDLLNVMWFQKMIKIAVKKFNQSKQPVDKKKL